MEKEITDNKVIAIIPARYGSTRFPGKPLALLGGREIILRVCDRVASAGIQVAVATDDVRIYDCVSRAGYQVVMTSADHQSGTDRVYEAYCVLKRSNVTKAEIILNVQGDEPFVCTESLQKLSKAFGDKGVDIATLYTLFPSGLSVDKLEDPNLVKLEINDRGEAMTFSRSVIPYLRGIEKREWPGSFEFKTHIGVYAYRSEVLEKLTTMARGKLEEMESLEQLRWLQAGFRIACVETPQRTIGIDTPEDLAEAEIFLASDRV